jgi:hypothetical protein
MKYFYFGLNHNDVGNLVFLFAILINKIFWFTFYEKFVKMMSDERKFKTVQKEPKTFERSNCYE